MPRSAPPSLPQRLRAFLYGPQSPVRPGFRTTLEGKFFIAGTFLIGFAAYNTGTNLLYLIFSMMLSLIIISALLSRSTLAGIQAERLVPTQLFAGEHALVHIGVRNDKRWFPTLSLRLTDQLSTGAPAGSAYAVRVRAGETIRTSYAVAFDRRGLWVFERTLLSTRYPFGFTEKCLALPKRQEVLVFPPLVDLSEEITEAQLDLGDLETGRRGPGSSLHGLREYVHGDPARHIHWRVSAKAGEVVVREFETEEKKRVNLCLENIGGPELAEDFEWAVIYTASLCKYLIDREYQIQLITRQGRVPFGSGPTHLGRLLRCLAIVELLEHATVGPSSAAIPAGDSTNIFIRWHDITAPGGFETIIDTSQWRPEEVDLGAMASVI